MWSFGSPVQFVWPETNAVRFLYRFLWRSKWTFNIPTLFLTFFDFPTLLLSNIHISDTFVRFEAVNTSVGKKSVFATLLLTESEFRHFY